MQMNMSIPAINQKSKLQYHQSPSMRREEERKKKKKKAPTQIYQLVHGPFSEQVAVKDGCQSQF